VADEGSVTCLRLSVDEERFEIARGTRDGERLQTMGDVCHRT
jgi:hypothetical protein